MRCKICDSSIDKPIWNSELGDWEICSACLEVVMSTFEDYPSIEEENKKELDNISEEDYNILKDVGLEISN